MPKASGVVYAAAAAERKRPSLGDRVRPVARAWKPLTVAGVALLVVVTAAGLLLVGPFEAGRVVHRDLDIAHWFVDQRTPTLNTLAEAGTWLAETITVSAVLLVAVVVSWRVSTNVAAPVFLAVSVGGEEPIYLISSSLVGRDRPPVPTVGTTYATSKLPFRSRRLGDHAVREHRSPHRASTLGISPRCAARSRRVDRSRRGRVPHVQRLPLPERLCCRRVGRRSMAGCRLPDGAPAR